MNIHFTKREFKAMRDELSAYAFLALLRKLPMERGDAIFMIARRCDDLSYGAVRDWEKQGIPRKHAVVLADLAKEYGVKMYLHQFRPTRAIVHQWLMYCFEADKHLPPTKQLFKRWEMGLKTERVA